MEKYRIDIKKSALKEIRKLPQEYLKKILQIIESLAFDPRPFGCIQLSDNSRYRVRVGQYRILYGINDQILTVIVVKVAHRREVYRR